MNGGGGPVLEAEGLGYTYEDGRRALEDIRFSIAAGEAAGVVGPNGAGKTTLLLALGGIYLPTQGEIRLFRDIRIRGGGGGELPQEVRRRIGLVFQESDDQLFSPTVFDDVAFGLLNFGFPREEVRGRVEKALAATGLSGFEDRTPHHLSAGEKRRVAIATVLVYEPDLLILDEPTSGLDPRSRRELAELLRRLPQAKVIASHDLEFVLKTCSRILLLDRGRIAASGPAEEILADPALLHEHGLEAPIGLKGLDANGLRELLASDALKGMERT